MNADTANTYYSAMAAPAGERALQPAERTSDGLDSYPCIGKTRRSALAPPLGERQTRRRQGERLPIRDTLTLVGARIGGLSCTR
jgi:hypothetical protein